MKSYRRYPSILFRITSLVRQNGLVMDVLARMWINSGWAWGAWTGPPRAKLFTAETTEEREDCDLLLPVSGCGSNGRKYSEPPVFPYLICVLLRPMGWSSVLLFFCQVEQLFLVELSHSNQASQRPSACRRQDRWGGFPLFRSLVTGGSPATNGRLLRTDFVITRSMSRALPLRGNQLLDQ